MAHHLLPHHEDGPTKTADVASGGINAWLATKITRGVGTMTCAWAFTGLALISFPSVLRSHDLVQIVSWVAQTFLQLVLLSIIIVGQNIGAAAADKRAEATYLDTEVLVKQLAEVKAMLQDLTGAQPLTAEPDDVLGTDGAAADVLPELDRRAVAQ